MRSPDIARSRMINAEKSNLKEATTATAAAVEAAAVAEKKCDEWFAYI